MRPNVFTFCSTFIHFLINEKLGRCLTEKVHAGKLSSLIYFFPAYEISQCIFFVSVANLLTLVAQNVCRVLVCATL